MISIFIYLKKTDRIGIQLFIIIIIFWLSVFTVSFEPKIINDLLNYTGLANRAQFLLIVSIVFILYLLFSQIVKSTILSSNLHYIVRKSTISNFKENNIIEKSDLIIVIIAKNEEKTIGNVIDEINSQKFPFLYNILVVNDGSTDETGIIAKKQKIEIIITEIIIRMILSTKNSIANFNHHLQISLMFYFVIQN